MGGPPPMLDMDGMMKKMMGDMGSMSMHDPPQMMGMPRMPRMPDMNSMMSTNSSTFSSSSSSSSSTQQQIGRGMDAFGGGGFPSMPPMMGMNMGGPTMPNSRLDIEELSSPTPSDYRGSPGPQRYTVTSPPPSVASPTPSQKSTASDAAGYTSHKVTAASSSSDTDSDSGVSSLGGGSYRSQRDPQADHTVLLKLREGSEYKLVLNMQQYPPENITVKLNDREITVLAHGARGVTVNRMGRGAI